MKKITIYCTALMFICATMLGCIMTRPSGKIDDYQCYYWNNTSNLINGSIKITFLGVSTLLLDDGETQLLIDGFFSRPPLRQVITSKIITNKLVIDSILASYYMNRIKGIFVAHSHYDHAMDVAYITKKTGAKLYGSYSSLNIGRSSGLKADQMQLYEPEKVLHCGNFSITVLQSKHSQLPCILNDIGEEIDSTLKLPAKMKKYVEGGSFDFLIKIKGKTIYIKPSANYIKGSLDSLNADILFLGTGSFGKKSLCFKNKYYSETVGKLKPKIVIPIHWDDFYLPFSAKFSMMPKFMDNTPRGFNYLIKKTKSEAIEFKILQGGMSIIL